jgi:hypothetical protein
VAAVLVAFAALSVLLIPSKGFSQTVATPEGQIISDGSPGLEVDPGLVVDIYNVPETPALPMPDPPSSSNSDLFWGYEASLAARILTYHITTPPHTGPDCVPTPTGNGRGVAMDPLDGNLWYTFLVAGFAGDGFIHKTTPPNTGACVPVDTIPFGDGPGGTIQDDIGALDIDQASKHIWAAGYKPVTVQGVLKSFFYLVNRNNGSIIHSCWIPFRDGGVGNDTLAYARLKNLPGSGQYLLTDAGEIATAPNSLAVIDTADCKNGSQVTPVTEFNKSVLMSGIDFEWAGLLATDLFNLYNLGDAPFATPTLLGPTQALLEDIGQCAFRAKFGGDGNDHCPY